MELTCRNLERRKWSVFQESLAWLKPVVTFVGEADFSESFTVVVIAVAAVAASSTADTAAIATATDSQ